MAALEGPPSEWEPILLALEGQGLDALASASTTSLMILVSAHGHRPHPPPQFLVVWLASSPRRNCSLQGHQG